MARAEFEEAIEDVCTIIALETQNRENSDEEMSGEDSELEDAGKRRKVLKDLVDIYGILFAPINRQPVLTTRAFVFVHAPLILTAFSRIRFTVISSSPQILSLSHLYAMQLASLAIFPDYLPSN